METTSKYHWVIVLRIALLSIKWACSSFASCSYFHTIPPGKDLFPWNALELGYSKVFFTLIFLLSHHFSHFLLLALIFSAKLQVRFSKVSETEQGKPSHTVMLRTPFFFLYLSKFAEDKQSSSWNERRPQPRDTFLEVISVQKSWICSLSRCMDRKSNIIFPLFRLNSIFVKASLIVYLYI